MEFLELRDLVIENLLLMYNKEHNLKNEEELKNLFKEYYLLDYDIFLDQIIFEIYYESYKESFKSIDNIYSIKKVCTKAYDEEIDESEEKKVLRTHNKYRKHQDKVSIMLNNGENVQLKDLKGGRENFKGQIVYEWQVNQLKNLASDRYGIFNEIVKGTLGDTDRLSGKKLVSYLKEYNELYKEIENQENTYFDRSIQYYQLEIGNRIETFYKLAEKLEEGEENKKLSWRIKESIIESLRCLSSIAGVNGIFQNKFIVGMDTYIDYQIKTFTNKDLNVINKVANEIYILNNNKYLLRKEILKTLKEENIQLNYNDLKLEQMCENFFGNRKYVCNNKNYSSKVIKNFRRAYR
ncbi:hypothetical protein GNF43_05170 [Clostridium perfringens]|uniref:Uncharacterized protein n=1 Tax=Clostridium perfringens TaxID=1502 RepID=A0AAW9IQK2_CLOPF|nr:hypothetical protein [Clostridium perfringens]MDZ5002749.1 hypothetical protein [Clostridium perfringens]MDZ5008228.1 hypothetical protein [Clostridium perfringens]MDZ5056396.1 hypothetical protein [Clostridium perfringens]